MSNSDRLKTTQTGNFQLGLQESRLEMLPCKVNWLTEEGSGQEEIGFQFGWDVFKVDVCI